MDALETVFLPAAALPFYSRITIHHGWSVVFCPSLFDTHPPISNSRCPS